MIDKELVKKHYQEEAQKWGDSSFFAMEDEITRQKETELILDFFDYYSRISSKVADIGCGNGYSLNILSKRWPINQYWGIDITKELLVIAKNRKLSNCKFIEGDVTSLCFENNFFDIIYTQRCLINILDLAQQEKALNEIHRVLVPGGDYLLIECFTDGLDNCNKARKECGLSELKPASFNRYFEKDLFLEIIKGKFSIIKHSNFLSSHYFVSRVLHALVTKGEQIRSTEFVKFFSFFPPIGEYSQIQAYILKKVIN